MPFLLFLQLFHSSFFLSLFLLLKTSRPFRFLRLPFPLLSLHLLLVRAGKLVHRRIEFDDGWGLVRASNTTPCLVLRFEARDELALNRIQDEFRRVMLQVDPSLSLPF